MAIYRVYQRFSELGDPSIEQCHYAHDALLSASELRRVITEMVQQWDVSSCDHTGNSTSEKDAWAVAADMSAGSTRYTREAAAYIASQAVVIETHGYNDSDAPDRAVTAYHGGLVWTYTIRPIMRVELFRNGSYLDAGHYTLAIAQRTDSSWDAIYEGGGDWHGISADDDIIALGYADGDCRDDDAALANGADILDAWASVCADMGYAEVADYLHARAYDARKVL